MEISFLGASAPDPSASGAIPVLCVRFLSKPLARDDPLYDELLILEGISHAHRMQRQHVSCVSPGIGTELRTATARNSSSNWGILAHMISASKIRMLILNL